VTKDALPLFAVVRLDLPHDGNTRRVFDEPAVYITVKEVMPSDHEAQREFDRLNALTADTDCVYFSVHTRFFPDGRMVAE
jgi:hypothetical protein